MIKAHNDATCLNLGHGSFCGPCETVRRSPWSMKSVADSKYENVVFFSVGSLCQGVSLSRSIGANLPRCSPYWTVRSTNARRVAPQARATDICCHLVGGIKNSSNLGSSHVPYDITVKW